MLKSFCSGSPFNYLTKNVHIHMCTCKLELLIFKFLWWFKYKMEFLYSSFLKKYLCLQSAENIMIYMQNSTSDKKMWFGFAIFRQFNKGVITAFDSYFSIWTVSAVEKLGITSNISQMVMKIKSPKSQGTPNLTSFCKIFLWQ